MSIPTTKITDLPQHVLEHIFSFITQPDPSLGAVCRQFDDLLGRIACQYAPQNTPPTLIFRVRKQPKNPKLTDIKIRRHFDRALLSQIRKTPGQIPKKTIAAQYAKIGEYDLAYQMVQEIDDRDDKAEALSKLAKIGVKQGNLSLAQRTLLESKALAKNISGQKKSTVLNQIAYTEYKLGLDFISNMTFASAIACARDHNLRPSHKASNLCEILLSMGQLAQTNDIDSEILQLARSQTNNPLCANLFYQPFLQVLNKIREHKKARNIISQHLTNESYSTIEREIGVTAAAHAQHRLSKMANGLFGLMNDAAIRAYYQARGGLIEQAEESLEEALGNFSDGYTCIDLLNIAKVELELGRVERGLQRLERAKEMSNNSPYILSNACRIEAGLGLLDRARSTAGKTPILLLGLKKSARAISQISPLYDIVESKDAPYKAILNAETYGILTLENLDLSEA